MTYGYGEKEKKIKASSPLGLVFWLVMVFFLLGKEYDFFCSPFFLCQPPLTKASVLIFSSTTLPIIWNYSFLHSFIIHTQSKELKVKTPPLHLHLKKPKTLNFQKEKKQISIPLALSLCFFLLFLMKTYSLFFTALLLLFILSSLHPDFLPDFAAK